MFSPVSKIQPVGEGCLSSEHETHTPDEYVQILLMLERLHRLLLDLIKDEFERLGHQELTPIQALILYNLGEDEVSAGELRSRGMYQGSNVSYNLKKLVSMGYIHHERCDLDRRSVRVRLTDTGMEIRRIIHELFTRHSNALQLTGILLDPPLEKVSSQFRMIERFWMDQIRYIY